MPDLTMPQALLIIGLVFAWLIFVIMRAWFEGGGR
jgi:hypothetical protein